jgi:hypothetical protein
VADARPAGRAVGRFEAALGVVGLLALGTTAVLITGWNPLPQLQELLRHSGSLTKPDAAWVQRVAGQPTSAVVADDTVVITMRGMVEARGVRAGEVRWQREADWAAVAGVESSMVAIVGRRGSGLEAVDPTTGNVRWKASDAIGAWTYRDLVLTLACRALSDCTLAARAPGDGATRWKMTLPGIGRVLAGANSELLGSRQLSGTYRGAVAAVPSPVPPLLGFPVDQRVQVVDTSTGKRLRQEDPSTTSRIVVVDGRVLVSTAVPKDGRCRYTLEARDAASGRTVWKKDGYDLRTASGVACEQRRDPAGAGGVLAAIRGDNREVLLAARDGREIWVGGPGETVVDTDGRYGLVRSADRKTLRVLDLSGGGGTAWTQPVPVRSDIAITRYAVLVSDQATTRLQALDPGSGVVLVDVTSTGEVLGSGPTGLMVGRGRTVGFVRYGTRR